MDLTNMIPGGEEKENHGSAPLGINLRPCGGVCGGCCVLLLDLCDGASDASFGGALSCFLFSGAAAGQFGAGRVWGLAWEAVTSVDTSLTGTTNEKNTLSFF